MKKLVMTALAFMLVLVTGCGSSASSSGEFVTKDNVGIKTDGLNLIEGEGVEFYSSEQWDNAYMYFFEETSGIFVMYIPYSLETENDEELSYETTTKSYEEFIKDSKVETVTLRGIEVTKITGYEEQRALDTVNESFVQKVESYFLPTKSGVIYVNGFGDNVDEKILNEVLQTIYLVEKE